MKRSVATAFLCLLLAAPAWAGYDEGLAAAKRGDYATALREWRPLAEHGHAPAQFNLGQMYRKGLGVPQDHAKTMAWYRKAAAQGYANAQHNLGVMYYYGHGVPREFVEAVKWYRKAAAQDYAKAQYSLGFMYAEGQHVRQDNVIAYMWWILAKDNANAAFNRKIFAKKMTPAQMAEAQNLAREWRATRVNSK